ncbi:MAG: monovalent cation/H(+) antiporter subunit G [Clostridia bacterium]|nr:monovalent cation/H(+) antiporter subunit G [Clostridia bacterium]
MSDIIRFLLSALFTLAGLFVTITSVLGVFRFRYALNRIHAAALLDTLGILFMLLGIIIALGFQVASLKAVILVVFLWMTSPVASHLIGRLQLTTDEHLSEHMEIESGDMLEEIKKEG